MDAMKKLLASTDIDDQLLNYATPIIDKLKPPLDEISRLVQNIDESQAFIKAELEQRITSLFATLEQLKTLTEQATQTLQTTIQEVTGKVSEVQKDIGVIRTRLDNLDNVERVAKSCGCCGVQ